MRRTGRFVSLIALFFAFALSGCARLAVRVDVLNPVYWSSPPYLNSVTLSRVVEFGLAIRDGRFVNQREDLKANVQQAVEQAVKEGTTAEVEAPKLIKNYNKTIDREFESARRDFLNAYDQAVATGKETDQAKNSYEDGSSKLRLLVASLEKGIRGNLGLHEDQSSPTLQTFQQGAQGVLTGLIGGAGIIDDPRAGAVVYAPEENWKGQYNQTLCSGWLGNSDCAVKMEGLGDFTLKGVRLDATKITQATFSVAKEAVQVVAAVYGIPVLNEPAQAGTSATAASGGQTTTGISSPVKRQADAETAVAQIRQVRLGMFETIVAQRQAINGDAAARASAIKTIKNVIHTFSTQLNPSTTK